MAGELVRSITGRGDYTVGRGIHGRGTRQAVRHSRSSIDKKGEMMISHSEYIGEMLSTNVIGSQNFVSQAYGINPGNSQTFPWLSGIANNFQEYEFIKLVFEYRPLISESTSTTAATLTSMGAVVIATQYDSSQGLYPNKQQMENSDMSVSVKPSGSALMAVECKPKYNPLAKLYVSAQTSATFSGVSNADIRMQNLALVQFSSANIPVANATAISLGEVWTHYTVRLLKPQEGYYASILSGHYVNSASTGTQAAATPFGPNVTAAIQPTQRAGSLLNCTFLANGTIVFPPAIYQGTYVLSYTCLGNPLGLNAPLVAAGFNVIAGGALLQEFTNDGNTQILSPQSNQNTITGVPASTFGAVCIFAVNAPGSLQAQIQLVTTNIPQGGGGYDLFITPLNVNIIT
jgi:hypothetical protein